MDDHKLVRQAISSLLKEDPNIELIGEAENGEDAIKLAKEKNPDIIFMDIRMPGIGGIQATVKIIKSNPKIKIIALTGCENDPFPSCMLKIGAKGYLTKSASLEKMREAISKVAAGENYLDPEVAQRLALKNLPGSTPGIFDSLSERELTIMMMVAKGIRVEAIAKKLFLSSKTINTYRYRIYKKLGLKDGNDVQLVTLAIKHDFLD